MEILFDSKRYARLYNCSSYRIDDVPFEQRQNLPFGISMITIFFVFSFLHSVCLFAMRKFFAQSSAYKVMFLMGLGHICCLSVTALLSGAFSLSGTVFCSAPTFNFFAGAVALFCWALTTSLSVLLAFERCVAQTFPNLAKLLFDGPRIWAWCLIILTYSIYYGFFTIPLTFSSITANWQFDPHVGYLADSSADGQNLYWNNIDAIHTIVVAVLLPSLYLFFAVMLSLKLTQIKKLPMTEQKLRKSVFIQVFILSFVLTIFSINYTLLNFVSVPDVMVSINMYLWVLLDGIPPFIYLALNSSIRGECLQIFRPHAHGPKTLKTRFITRTQYGRNDAMAAKNGAISVNNFVNKQRPKTAIGNVM